MLDNVGRVIPAGVVDAWVFFLRGLWASGLRLEEAATNLYWDRDDRIRPLMDLEEPLLRIPRELHKSNVDQLLPMAPEFAVMLQGVPAKQRRGRVFRLPGEAGTNVTAETAGKRISRMGKLAGVVVPRDPKDPEKVKYALAHDLRRTFGDRWSRKIMPADLKDLMRHESIETTLRYYVGQNTEGTARKCWEIYRESDGFGFEAPKPAPKRATAK